MIQTDKIFRKSFLAGASIGFAGLIYLLCNDQLIGSILFSLGLLSVCLFDFNLFTGKSGFLSDRYDFRRLILVLLINLFGSFLLGVAAHFSLDSIRQSADLIVSSRLNADFSELIIKSVLTGFLMTLAIESERKSNNSNHIILILSVAGFILSGSYHCIADAFYYGSSSLLADNTGSVLLRLSVVIASNFIGCTLHNMIMNNTIIHKDTE